MGGFPFKNFLKNEEGALGLFHKESAAKKEAEKLTEQSPSVNISFRSLLQGEQAAQLNFTGLSEEDIHNLVEMRPIMERNASRIVGAFYEKLQNMPNLIAIIEKHSTIDKLKKTLTQYLLDMVSGDIGKDYVIRRKIVGNVHNRIGLFPEWYIGSIHFNTERNTRGSDLRIEFLGRGCEVLSFFSTSMLF